MASTKSYMMARNYRFLANDSSMICSPPPPAKPELEFDESDIWGGSTRSKSPDSRPTWRHQTLRPVAAPPSVKNRRGDTASSLPVNVPDWSKILRQEYCKSGEFNGGYDVNGVGGGGGGYVEDDDEDEWVPPHEYLARTRMASFSVHEGVGRTLKGRDLSKVRNAIWEKTGFQD